MDVVELPTAKVCPEEPAAVLSEASTASFCLVGDKGSQRVLSLKLSDLEPIDDDDGATDRPASASTPGSAAALGGS
ncbi:MAG: hypothetical protein AAF627_10655 [Myxococcota bacterium]